jgi:hypothetical protein
MEAHKMFGKICCNVRKKAAQYIMQYRTFFTNHLFCFTLDMRNLPSLHFDLVDGTALLIVRGVEPATSSSSFCLLSMDAKNRG